MVRRGSTVRVRQRAYRKRLQFCRFQSESSLQRVAHARLWSIEWSFQVQRSRLTSARRRRCSQAGQAASEGEGRAGLITRDLRVMSPGPLLEGPRKRGFSVVGVEIKKAGEFCPTFAKGPYGESSKQLRSRTQ